MIGYTDSVLNNVIQKVLFLVTIDSESSKISNISWLQKMSRQSEQTQIRLLLKKQSDQGLPCLLFGHAFC